MSNGNALSTKRRLIRTRFGQPRTHNDFLDPEEEDIESRQMHFAQFDMHETKYTMDRYNWPCSLEEIRYVEYVPLHLPHGNTEDDNANIEMHEIPPRNCTYRDSQSMISFIYQEFPLPKPPNSPCIQIYMTIVNDIVLNATEKDKLIIEYKPFKIYQHNLYCFLPGKGQWIQDDIMDYYLALLTARKRTATRSSKYAKVYTFQATFYTLLSQTKGLDLVKLSADGDNIFNYELLFFPVCISHHWRLVVVNVAERKVIAYNSIKKTKDLLIVKKIIRYLTHEYQRVHKNAVEHAPQWNSDLNIDIPQQDNGDDCGVFTLLYADYLSSQKSFNFDASHILYFRYKLLYECISGRLILNSE